MHLCTHSLEECFKLIKINVICKMGEKKKNKGKRQNQKEEKKEKSETLSVT